MKIEINREALLAPLSVVAGVVERRQTLNILSNVLFVVNERQLTLTGTDLEVEMCASATIDAGESGSTTISARKLVDICRALPDGSGLQIQAQQGRLEIVSGKSRFTLSTLAAEDYPQIEELKGATPIDISESALRFVIEHSAFSMAQQDVRYFLNGLYLSLSDTGIRAVATDGHRLAIADHAAELTQSHHFILPRKAVLELGKLLDDSEDTVRFEVGDNHVRVSKGPLRFTTKLIDGRYPDYESVVPLGVDKVLQVDRLLLREALQRTAILTNEKYKGVRLEVESNLLRLVAHNPEQEEAVEELSVEYSGAEIKVGFNVGYLIEALNALDGDVCEIKLRDADSSGILRAPNDDAVRHVIMPLKL